MEKDTKQNDALAPVTPPEEIPAFKGFTIRELKYRRALVAVKRNYVLEQLINEKHRITSLSFLGDKKSGKTKGFSNIVSRSGSIASTILKGLSYMDYISLGVSILGAGKKVSSWFRKKK